MKLFKNKSTEILLEDIVLNKINPNKMSDQTFNKLKLSLQSFGQLNSILVRKLPDNKNKYEIIDGEWRYKAAKELGWLEIQGKVIEASDEELSKIILTSTIKGRHDIYSSRDIVKKLIKTENKDTLEACNLDEGKIERKLKYSDSSKMKVVKGRRIKDEKDSDNVKPIDQYKKLILLKDAPEYCKIENSKIVLK